MSYGESVFMTGGVPDRAAWAPDEEPEAARAANQQGGDNDRSSSGATCTARSCTLWWLQRSSLINLAGYAFLGGRDFVEGWGGGLAAVIATGFLVWKSQGYWAWMIVNAGLWCALFFSSGLPLLGWLQVSFLGFAAYGMLQWALVKWRIGWNPRVRSD